MVLYNIYSTVRLLSTQILIVYIGDTCGALYNIIVQFGCFHHSVKCIRPNAPCNNALRTIMHKYLNLSKCVLSLFLIRRWIQPCIVHYSGQILSLY